MRKLILFVIMLFCLACSQFFAQTIEYSYHFTEKLRTNIDEIITKGVEDTCGVIDFNYPIQLSNGEEALVFRVENDCSPVIDFSKLLPQGNFLEVIISEKYEAMVNAQLLELEEIPKAVSDFIAANSAEETPLIMLRVDRSCKNVDKINAILTAVHSGAIKKDKEPTSLIFDLGKSSRAEPPRINIQIEEDN